MRTASILRLLPESHAEAELFGDKLAQEIKSDPLLIEEVERISKYFNLAIERAKDLSIERAKDNSKGTLLNW